MGLDHVDAEQLEDALRSGPSISALREIRRQTDLLEIALSNLVNVFNPQVIVLGGFLGVLLAEDKERLSTAVAAGAISGLGAEVRLERAALGAELLLVGAAEAVFAEVLAEPRRVASRQGGVSSGVPIPVDPQQSVPGE
jgi:predicted NBD/HSP70 family sugar kinase